MPLALDILYFSYQTDTNPPLMITEPLCYTFYSILHQDDPFIACIGSQVLLSFYCLGVLDTTVRHQAAERGALHIHHRPQVRYLH